MSNQKQNNNYYPLHHFSMKGKCYIRKYGYGKIKIVDSIDEFPYYLRNSRYFSIIGDGLYDTSDMSSCGCMYMLRKDVNIPLEIVEMAAVYIAAKMHDTTSPDDVVFKMYGYLSYDKFRKYFLKYAIKLEEDYCYDDPRYNHAVNQLREMCKSLLT